MRDQIRLPCAEPLECRSLLSSAVQAVEIDRPQDDSDTIVAVTALPAAVVSEVQSQYPGAKLIEASYSDDDGPEFGITIESPKLRVEVSLTPQGQITGVEEVISPHALPRAITDWVTQTYPRSHIDDASIADDSGVVSYGILIVTPAGRELDATLWLANAQQAQEKPSPAAMEIPMAASDEWLEDSNEAPSSGENRPIKNSLQQQIPVSTDQIHFALPEQSDAPVIHALIINLSAAGAGAVTALSSFAIPTASMLSLPAPSIHVLPANLSFIEHAFADILKQVEALAQKASAKTVQSSALARIAVAGLFVAGALLLRHPRKIKGAPLLLKNAANSSWSWIIGVSAPK